MKEKTKKETESMYTYMDLNTHSYIQHILSQTHTHHTHTHTNPLPRAKIVTDINSNRTFTDTNPGIKELK